MENPDDNFVNALSTLTGNREDNQVGFNLTLMQVIHSALNVYKNSAVRHQCPKQLSSVGRILALCLYSRWHCIRLGIEWCELFAQQ